MVNIIEWLRERLSPAGPVSPPAQAVELAPRATEPSVTDEQFFRRLGSLEWREHLRVFEDLVAKRAVGLQNARQPGLS